MAAERGPSWTVMDVLRWTAADLSQRGSSSPRLDAEVLLAHALGIDRMGLYLAHDRPLSEDERSRYRRSVERRRAGEPVAYIVGEKEFWSLPMFVDRRVLVPRPETEVLVEEALRCLGTAREGGRALDVGTGSGAIVLALLRECPALTADAIDVSAAALEVAERNALRHGVRDRVRLLCGHLDEPVRGGEPYDLVTANLPYVPSAEVASLPVAVTGYEPHAALDGGADGLRWIAELVERLPELLVPGGSGLLEVGDGQASAVLHQARGTTGLGPAKVIRDLAGVDRVVVVERR